MNSKRTLVQKPPTTWDVLHEHAPFIIFYGSIALIIVIALIIMVYFQAPIAQSHEMGLI